MRTCDRAPGKSCAVWEQRVGILPREFWSACHFSQLKEGVARGDSRGAASPVLGTQASS